jgi:hypothetical protein
VTRLLVDNDADVVAEDGDGWTPLLLASHQGMRRSSGSFWTAARPGSTPPSPASAYYCMQAKWFLALTHDGYGPETPSCWAVSLTWSPLVTGMYELGVGCRTSVRLVICWRRPLILATVPVMPGNHCLVSLTVVRSGRHYGAGPSDSPFYSSCGSFKAIGQHRP